VLSGNYKIPHYYDCRALVEFHPLRYFEQLKKLLDPRIFFILMQ